MNELTLRAIRLRPGDQVMVDRRWIEIDRALLQGDATMIVRTIGECHGLECADDVVDVEGGRWFRVHIFRHVRVRRPLVDAVELAAA